MAMLTGKSCWALVAQALPCCYFCRFVLSLSLSARAVPEVGICRARCRSRSLGVSLPQMFIFSIFHLKLYNRI
jgi:hypothetical protein